ncbi:expressed unknown protein [Seminavis robusta]|uniref:glutathione gamma-glutamylcysteinyltransferase n=1 Tax=Seminavis robusta TaxID=568900 RepID=A0A9N8HDS7_9STRA|nr:expressed unknown protein [Seminavis robusta]|eukprot:Sro375_g129410.1 n/a (266) ;mRNA; r:28204-29001
MSDSHRTYRSLVRHNRAMETGEPSIIHSPEFHDNNLLRQAWAISPYNRKRHKKSPPNANIRKEIIRNAMCFQPVSGYCGMATVNTVLTSLNPPYFVQYPDHGRGYSMYSLAEYLIVNCVPHQFTDVDAIFMERKTTLDQFRAMLQQYVNSPDYRLLANFHRTPLFYSERSTEEEARYRAWAGHWSPVGGLIQTRDDKEYVLVLDTNEKYGPFMVSLERFFLAVKTETLEDGYRGFLKVKINPAGHQQRLQAPAPAPFPMTNSADC